jgi:hypothetical protein
MATEPDEDALATYSEAVADFSGHQNNQEDPRAVCWGEERP